MLTRTCSKCQSPFALADAHIDAHWNTWSWEPAHCHCPHCGARLDDVHPDSVDLARHLTPTVLTWAMLALAAGAAAVASGTLGYVGPLMIGAFGLWLGRRAVLREHRIAGWLLVVIALATAWFANHAG
jgi:hypothetical protein